MPVHPFLDVPGPIGFAHRGGADEAPENTLPAFQAAYDLGYRYLETDVHLTVDAVLMAFHDPRLDRVTDRGGRISERTAAEVEAADAGFHFSLDDGATFPYRGAGVRVPRLEALLDGFPDARINIDVKDDRAVAPLCRLLRDRAALDRVCIGSFSDARLAAVRAELGASVCTSLGPRGVLRARISAGLIGLRSSAANCLQIPVRSRGVPLVTPRMIRAAHAAGLPVHVWTVNDAASMERLLDMGIDGIMTDRPAALRSVFAARGRAVSGQPLGADVQ